jgi:hypothetical protein
VLSLVALYNTPKEAVGKTAQWWDQYPRNGWRYVHQVMWLIGLFQPVDGGIPPEMGIFKLTEMWSVSNQLNRHY